MTAAPRRLTALLLLTLLAVVAGRAVEKVEPPRFKAGPAYTASARVETDQPGRPISNGIYGVCDLPRDKLIEYGIKITRWGGNPSTRYNWELGVDNGAADWYFKNRGNLLEHPADNGWLKTIERNQAFGATTYQTVPMIGWVAKDASSYGFSVAKYGPQKATEPGHPDVGNGVKPDGSFVTGNDPNDTSAAAPPEFIAEGVQLGGQARRQGGRLRRLARREILGVGQRADALARHAPRRFPQAAQLRRAMGAHREVRDGDPIRGPDGEGVRLLRLGLDGPVLFGRGRRRRQLPDAAGLQGARQGRPGRVVHHEVRRVQEGPRRQGAGGRVRHALVSAMSV